MSTPLVNALTKEEMKRILNAYSRRTKIVGIHQCVVLYNTKGRPMAHNGSGYVHVSVRKHLSETRVAKLLGANGKTSSKNKVSWHQLNWRAANDGAIQTAHLQIAHRCGNPGCGAQDHLVAVSRRVNESHKKCRYVTDGESVYLVCGHEPHCLPGPELTPLTKVSAELAARIWEEQE